MRETIDDSKFFIEKGLSLRWSVGGLRKYQDPPSVRCTSAVGANSVDNELYQQPSL
jgi:hypothetical protein